MLLACRAERFAIQTAADVVFSSVACEIHRLTDTQENALHTALTAEEVEYLQLAAEAFAVGELFKIDHPLTPALVRKGMLRTSGKYAMITDLGVDFLRARGHQGPLPVSRAKVLGSRSLRVGA